MSTKGTEAPIAGPKTPVTAEETPERVTPARIGEGVGVFRAIIRTVLLYVAFGLLAWLAWRGFEHWRGQ